MDAGSDVCRGKDDARVECAVIASESFPHRERDPGLFIRRGLLLVAAAVALTGILAGLSRLGVAVAWGPAFAYEHGPLLVLGLFGTVIGLERAVALGHGWAFVAPMAGAAAALAMLTGLSWAPWAGAASTVALVAVNIAILHRQAAAFTWLMLAGSAVLAMGSVAWALGRPVFEVVPNWIAFFVLTIAAERLELSRLAPTPRWATRALVFTASVLAIAACARLAEVPGSAQVLGVSVALVGGWELRFDLARRTIRARGLPRFSAVGVLSGAGWLVVSGALLAARDLPAAGPFYDAVLHGVFVGFVLSMVLAHAPIILPAVARVEIPYHSALWVSPAVLHTGLLLRVLGDLIPNGMLRQFGAVANAVAVVLFPAVVAVARMTRRRRTTVRD